MQGGFSSTGHTVFVTGSMWDSFMNIKGADEAMEVSLGSCCYGAGSLMPRHEARKQNDGYSVVRELQKSGITVYTQSMKSAAEEAPSAYKNIDMVIDAVTGARLADKIAFLKSVTVIKG